MPHPRHICFLLALLLTPVAVYSQASGYEFLPVEIDTRNFPSNRLSFYLLDPSGQPTSDLLASDFFLQENTRERELLSLTCPEQTDPPRLSTVLALDVSGSMFEEGRMEIARSAARLWINELRLGYSEAAVVSFDHEAHLLHDFSTNRTRLLESLEGLQPLGGTSYNAGLLDRPFGAIPLASTGSHKRVVLFLTDGRSDGRFDEMIEEARLNDVVVHVLLMDGQAPEGLRELARESGGLLFQDISTKEEAEKIFRLLLHHARGLEPCTLSWEGLRSCDAERTLEISIPLYGVSWSTGYQVSDTRLSRLRSKQVGVSFGFTGVGLGARKELEWSAEGDSLTVYQLQISDGGLLCRERRSSLASYAKRW